MDVAQKVDTGDDDIISLSVGALSAVLRTATDHPCLLILLTDGSAYYSSVFKLINQLKTPCLFGFFEVSAGSHDANFLQKQLSKFATEAQRLRQVSWCVTVVVVSDDLAFLATFARTSNNSRLLVPETRLLAITRQPLVQLEVVKETFSLKNAMFLVVNTSSGSLRCGVYLQVPYSPLDAQALQVASWTPQRGLALTSSLPLFPDKFSRFLHRPNLRVVSVESTSHRLVLVDDPEVPGKKRITFEGIMANVNDYLAKALNFT
ncbi:uncharacterized protein [Procambarus clarkii]|uniref:uncharacterized protein n=1 Tax=Procambarus clarkii TaxID=6728 RepID=UPI0037428776